MARSCDQTKTFGISIPFGMLSPSKRQVVYVLLTRLPLRNYRNNFSVRLACVRHAASVRPEPGSNSPINFIEEPFGSIIIWLKRNCLFADSSEEPSCAHLACLLFALFSFQRTLADESAHLVYHIVSLLSTTFCDIFFCCLPSRDDLFIIA